MEEKTMFHSLMKTILGRKYILMITDTAQIMSRQEQLENNSKFRESFQKISTSIKNHIISGGALAIALTLSLQRYFPTQFSTFSLNKILIDLAVVSVCLFTASNMSLNKNLNQIGIIKKELMINFDKSFLHHMADIQIKYDIEEQDQVRGILTQEEYKNWLEKRHQHIF